LAKRVRDYQLAKKEQIEKSDESVKRLK